MMRVYSGTKYPLSWSSVFKIQSTYLEIVFVPKDFLGWHSKFPRQWVYSSIYHVVDAGIKQVMSDLYGGEL